MRGAALAVLLAGCGAARGGDSLPVPRGTTYSFDFDLEPPGRPGTGTSQRYRPHRTFFSVLGDWGIARDPSAPSAPNVYRQSGKAGPGEEPRVIVGELTFADLTARVRCRPESGESQEACGLMFHLEDAEDYLLAVADAKAQKLRLVHVERGLSHEIASADTTVAPWEWHALEVKTRGPRILVYWNGTKLLDAWEHARTSGKVGLWTRADTVAAFDDLSVSAD